FINSSKGYPSLWIAESQEPATAREKPGVALAIAPRACYHRATRCSVRKRRTFTRRCCMNPLTLLAASLLLVLPAVLAADTPERPRTGTGRTGAARRTTAPAPTRAYP